MIQLIELHLFCNALWSKVICLPKKVLQSSTLWLSNPWPGGWGRVGVWGQDDSNPEIRILLQIRGIFLKSKVLATLWNKRDILVGRINSWMAFLLIPLSRPGGTFCPGGTCVGFFIKANPGSSWVWVSIALCLRQHCRVSVWKYNWLGKRNMNQLCIYKPATKIYLNIRTSDPWTEFCGEPHEPL